MRAAGLRLIEAMMRGHADVAQLVEHHLAKVRVAGSNPVVRSKARVLDAVRVTGDELVLGPFPVS